MTILSNGHMWKHSEFIENNNFLFDKKKILKSLSEKDIDDAYSSISAWDGYTPTPLIELNKLSKELNLNRIFYKDESKRFDLKSFKALGGAYAVEKVAKVIKILLLQQQQQVIMVDLLLGEQEDLVLNVKFLLVNSLVMQGGKQWLNLELTLLK